MLGKLIKHEWKAICKVGYVMILVIAAVTAIGCIMLQIPAMTELFSNADNMSEMQIVGWTLMGVMSLMVYIFMLMGATYGILIFLGVRFYKTMYTDQGYLTNTLPVTAHQLLISKILTSGIWYLIIAIMVFVSVFALFASMLSGILSNEMKAEGFDNIWQVFGMMISEIGPAYEEMGLNLTHYAITMVLMVLVGPFTAVAVLFGSLTLGQLSKKYKALMGILAYFGVMFVNMIIGMIVQFIMTFKYSMAIINSPNGSVTVNMNSTYDTSLITVAAMAVILYVASHHILTKKLNMD